MNVTVIVLLSVGLGFVNELRSERTVAALHEPPAPTSLHCSPAESRCRDAARREDHCAVTAGRFTARPGVVRADEHDRTI